MRIGGRRRRLLGAAALAAGLLIWGGDAQALTDEEIFREFAFNFINPGARAMGLGGAFTGIADDMTAAQANPAGLSTFSDPKFSVEYGVIERDLQVVSGESGSLDVDPITGERDLPFFGVNLVSDAESVNEPTFLGLAWPIRVGNSGRVFTVSASRQLVLSEERTLSSGDQLTETRFAFDTFPNTVNGDTLEAYSVNMPVAGNISNEIVHWDLGLALKVHPDLSLGFTLTAATLDLRTETLTRVVDPLELFLDPTHPRLPAQPTTDLYGTTVNDSDTDFTFSVGYLWHPDTVFAGGPSPWKLGVVYRKGARFTVDESTTLNDTPDDTFSNSIIVPDRYAVGLSYRTKEHWLFTAEIERIEYSDLLEDFRIGVNFLTSSRVAAVAFDLDPEQSIEYRVDDGVVPKVGVEFVRSTAGRERLALRAGYFRMPDDRIRMSQFNSDDPDVNDAYLEAFRGGEETDHVTAGVGYTVGRSSIGIAGAVSDAETRVVGSYSFSLTRRR